MRRTGREAGTGLMSSSEQPFSALNHRIMGSTIILPKPIHYFVSGICTKLEVLLMLNSTGCDEFLHLFVEFFYVLKFNQ